MGWFWVVRSHPRSSARSSIDRVHRISFSSLIETMRLYCTVFEIPCRYSELFVEIRRLYPTPPEFGAPIGGDPVWISKRFWHQKTRVPGLSCSVVCVILCIAVLIQYWLVTDRHTQTQTLGHGIYHTEHSSRGKNTHVRLHVHVVCSLTTSITSNKSYC